MGRPPLHGKRQHPLYVNWRAMRWRCLSPTADGYALYGGRGIRICDAWANFACFYEWAMSNGWAPGLTVDRIDPNGNYEPTNCRWATAKQQGANRRARQWGNQVMIDGEERSLRQWAKVCGVQPSTLYKRYASGVRGADLIAPPDEQKSHKQTV